MMRAVITALVTIALLAVTDWRVPMTPLAALPWLAAWAGLVAWLMRRRVR